MASGWPHLAEAVVAGGGRAHAYELTLPVPAFGGTPIVARLRREPSSSCC